ncbi:hypothetical protein DFP73DRAFT_529913 [Morchella snyderi]|nr:hypothetical protein DFP73DRAFT_529913 [Morchella snyderi]
MHTPSLHPGMRTHLSRWEDISPMVPAYSGPRGWEDSLRVLGSEEAAIPRVLRAPSLLEYARYSDRREGPSEDFGLWRDDKKKKVNVLIEEKRHHFCKREVSHANHKDVELYLLRHEGRKETGTFCLHTVKLGDIIAFNELRKVHEVAANHVNLRSRVTQQCVRLKFNSIETLHFLGPVSVRVLCPLVCAEGNTHQRLLTITYSSMYP